MTPVLVLVQYKSGPAVSAWTQKLQERVRVGWSYPRQLKTSFLLVLGGSYTQLCTGVSKR